MPGPIPSREADLARPRERKGSDIVPVTKGVLRTVTVPHADPDWHPIAARLYEALKTSGQADFYQDSDWAFAYSLCDDLSLLQEHRQAIRANAPVDLLGDGTPARHRGRPPPRPHRAARARRPAASPPRSWPSRATRPSWVSRENGRAPAACGLGDPT